MYVVLSLYVYESGMFMCHTLYVTLQSVLQKDTFYFIAQHTLICYFNIF